MNPNAVFDQGNTALHIAVIRNIPELVTWLLGQGANLGSENFENQTPLDLARLLGHRQLVRFLEKKIVLLYLSEPLTWKLSPTKSF